jgi:SAM-dependent methyltransferase
MNLRPRRLEGVTEHLDEGTHDMRVLAGSLRQIAAVNRWLGGTRGVLREIGHRFGALGALSVLDVGCGDGDTARVLSAWGRSRGIDVRVTGLDLHRQTAAIARRRCAADDRIAILRGNALALPFADDAFDCALLSLTLHHFDGEEQRSALRELGRVARHTAFVSELDRSWLNYLGARLMSATLWRLNPLTRHDGPLSVLRAFTPDELVASARAAGLGAPRVREHFFCRLLLAAGRHEPCTPDDPSPRSHSSLEPTHGRRL